MVEKLGYGVIFFAAAVIIGWFNCNMFNEIVYNLKKGKKDGYERLKRLAIKMIKRTLKTDLFLFWIAYETYVKSQRPNTYTMGSWLFNMKIVEGREFYILALIAVTFIIALVFAWKSRERLIGDISLDKRTLLRNRVKSWDETKLTEEQKEELYLKFNGIQSKDISAT